MLLNKLLFFRNCMMAMSLVFDCFVVFRELVDRFGFWYRRIDGTRLVSVLSKNLHNIEGVLR